MGFKGRRHTTEAKLRIAEAASEHQRDDGNSQAKTRWITNGIENAKIHRNDPLPDGWDYGRVMGRKKKHDKI